MNEPVFLYGEPGADWEKYALKSEWLVEKVEPRTIGTSLILEHKGERFEFVVSYESDTHNIVAYVQACDPVLRDVRFVYNQGYFGESREDAQEYLLRVLRRDYGMTNEQAARLHL